MSAGGVAPSGGWDFARGGLAVPRARADAAGLGEAVEAALASLAAQACAVGAVVALRGVAMRYGLAWEVAACGAAVRVGGLAGRRREAVLVWRGRWMVSLARGWGEAGVVLAREAV